MKVLLIEDEKPAFRRITKLLQETDPDIEIVGTLDSIETAVNWLSTHPAPELMILDIHLADGSSFEIFKKVTVQCPVIFTTAFDEYAIDAFKVNSVDYLLKPIKHDELEAALLKLKNLRHHYSTKGLDTLVQNNHVRFKDRFVIRLGNKIKSVLTNDIAYFYSRDKLSFICDKEGKHYPIDLSLDKLETLLDPEQFFRVNRQIITHVSSIVEIQTANKSRIILTLKPPCIIESVISSERSAIFKKWLKKE